MVVVYDHVMKEKKRKNVDLKYIFSVVFAVMVIISLVRMIWGNLEGLRRVKDLRSETQTLQERNEQLETEIEERGSLEYVEEQARRKIGMVKEGERVLIYPEKKGNSGVENEEIYMEGDLCYWCEWLNVFGL